MFIKKTRISKYVVRVSSPRISPSSSISDVEWNNEKPYKKKTFFGPSRKKIRCNFVVIACGLMIAILITIAILVPLIIKSKSTTTTTASISNIAAITNVSVIPTNSVSTASSTTNSTMTSSISVTTTITYSISTSTTSETTTTTTSSTTSTSSETTTSIGSTGTVTASYTTTATASSTTSTSSETTTSTSTGTVTASDTTTTTTSSTTSTNSETTTITYSISISTTSETTTTTTTSTSSETTTSTSTTTASSTTSTSSETTTSTGSTSTSTTSDTTTSTSTSTTTMAPLRWNTTGITGGGGFNTTNISAIPNCLFNPKGIVLDLSDTLYVADTDHHRVQHVFVGYTNDTTIAGNSSGVSGSTATFLSYPNDIAVDSYGNLYVADTFNNRVQLWRVNASSGITIASGAFFGNTTNQFARPRGIAFDLNTNTYYVSDTNNNLIIKYTLNSTVGVLVAGGTGPGLNNTQLNSPRGLYFDSTTNSLIIANHDSNNVIQWVIGASYWTLVAGNINGSSGSGQIALNGPWDVILDPMGNVYVADTGNHRIQFFQAGTINGTTIAGVSGSSGSTPTKLNQPYSVALDSQLNLYVSDTNNDRVQKFLRY